MSRVGHAGRWSAAVVCAVGIFLTASILSAQQRQIGTDAAVSLALQRGVAVYGYIFVHAAGVDARSNSTDIYLPNVAVRLESTPGGARIAPGITNTHGMFTISAVAAGTYRVCWEAEGFIAGCTGAERPVSVGGTSVFPGPIEIHPRATVVAGKVTPCFQHDAIFGVDTKTEVSLVNAAGIAVTKPVAANFAGQFVIADAPPGDLRLRAECNGLRGEAALNRQTGAIARLAFAPSPLQIKSVLATDSNRIIRKAKPGQTVRVSVEVSGAEKEALQYRWFTADSDQLFASFDGPAVSWTLPAHAGTNTMRVMVTDKRGGRAIGQVSVTTGEPDAIFSATVTDQAGKPLKGAEVSVNGTRTQTNDVGYFFHPLPEENARYVLNIRSTGHALASHISLSRPRRGKAQPHACGDHDDLIPARTT